MENGPHRAGSSAAQFHSNESGNTEKHEDEKENQEGRINRKNGRGKNTREG